MDISVQNVGKFFFPHRKKLKLLKENYSPDLYKKIVYAGAHSTTSFERAHDNLINLAEIEISVAHLKRLTVRIASEFDHIDSQRIDNWHQDLPSQNDQDIQVASISVDGGRVQTRQEPSGTGVHNPKWTETKVACLQVLQSVYKDRDPHPQLPRIFQDRKTVQHMVAGLKRETSSRDKPEGNNHHVIQFIPDSTQNESNKDTTYAPEVINKFVLADIIDADTFGHSLYHKAHLLGIHTAERKAFLGDGDTKLWKTIYDINFKAENWTPILDFIHATEYAYDAARLSTDSDKQAWTKYIEFISHIWQGRTLTVIRRLETIINQLRSSHKNKSKALQDKIVTLSSIRNYFKNNLSRMKYHEYRKNGLPISSCHVESLIKQFNVRIKSSEKFWNPSSVKGVVKIKASLLSNDNSWDDFWNNRYDYQLSSKRKYIKPGQKLAA